jgi:inhibitor of cysteine peptidase
MSSGCATSSGNGQILIEPAQIEKIEIAILESFPVQVQVRIYGILADSCTEQGDITQQREGNDFLIQVLTRRPAQLDCATVISLFEEVVALDVYGLPAGSYTVDVNGVRGTFILDMDNRLE